MNHHPSVWDRGTLSNRPVSKVKTKKNTCSSDSPDRTGIGNTNAEALPSTHNETATVENFMVVACA